MPQIRPRPHQSFFLLSTLFEVRWICWAVWNFLISCHQSFLHSSQKQVVPPLKCNVYTGLLKSRPVALSIINQLREARGALYELNWLYGTPYQHLLLTTFPERTIPLENATHAVNNQNRNTITTSINSIRNCDQSAYILSRLFRNKW